MSNQRYPAETVLTYFRLPNRIKKAIRRDAGLDEAHARRLNRLNTIKNMHTYIQGLPQ